MKQSSVSRLYFLHLCMIQASITFHSLQNGDFRWRSKHYMIIIEFLLGMSRFVVERNRTDKNCKFKILYKTTAWPQQYNTHIVIIGSLLLFRLSAWNKNRNTWMFAWIDECVLWNCNPSANEVFFIIHYTLILCTSMCIRGDINRELW